MAKASILVAYFSHSGNTRAIAEQIHERVGGDLFRIETVDPYPREYSAVVEVARKEQKASARPRLTKDVTNLASYAVLYVGYPNWWATMPMPVFTFLEGHDLSGKTVIPFCTHEGSGMGRSGRDIKELCPKSVVLDGLAVRGGSVRSAEKNLIEWLERLAVARK